jgi:hypothetical protein
MVYEYRVTSFRTQSAEVVWFQQNGSWRKTWIYALGSMGDWNYTAIPYRARTGPEQGFPCVVILTGKNLFYYREPLFSLQGSCIHYRDFPVRITTQGNPCSHYRELVCSVEYFGFVKSNDPAIRAANKIKLNPPYVRILWWLAVLNLADLGTLTYSFRRKNAFIVGIG